MPSVFFFPTQLIPSTYGCTSSQSNSTHSRRPFSQCFPRFVRHCENKLCTARPWDYWRPEPPVAGAYQKYEPERRAELLSFCTHETYSFHIILSFIFSFCFCFCFLASACELNSAMTAKTSTMPVRFSQNPRGDTSPFQCRKPRQTSSRPGSRPALLCASSTHAWLFDWKPPGS